MSTGLLYSLLWAWRFLIGDGQALQPLEQRAERRLLAELGPADGELKPIARVAVDDLELAARERLLTADAPLIIEGALKGSSALDWTLDTLYARYGATPADGIVRVESRSAQPTLADVIDAIRAGKEAHANATMRIFQDHPETLRALNIARIERVFRRKVMAAQMFVSSAQSVAYYHSELAPNLSIQIYGQKKWTLVSPGRQALMYPDVGHRDRRDMLYYLAAKSYERNASGALAPKDAPLIDCAPKHVAVLNPGDVLYCPIWWWHEVTNPTDSVGVSLRLFPTAAELARFPVRTLIGASAREPMRISGRIIADKLRGRRRLADFDPNRIDYSSDRADQLAT